MANTSRFVQIGEKKKGRIIKNENYSVRKFIQILKLSAYMPALDTILNIDKISMWDKLFKTEKYNEYIEYTKHNDCVKFYRRIEKDIFSNIEKKINSLISKDN